MDRAVGEKVCRTRCLDTLVARKSIYIHIYIYIYIYNYMAVGCTRPGHLCCGCSSGCPIRNTCIACSASTSNKPLGAERHFEPRPSTLSFRRPSVPQYFPYCAMPNKHNHCTEIATGWTANTDGAHLLFRTNDCAAGFRSLDLARMLQSWCVAANPNPFSCRSIDLG